MRRSAVGFSAVTFACLLAVSACGDDGTVTPENTPDSTMEDKSTTDGSVMEDGTKK